jgi:hypothetical protein
MSNLPARLSGLARVALVIIATSATTAAFTSTAAGAAATTAAEAASPTTAKASTSSASGTVRLRLGFVDLQSASLEFGAVQRSDGFFGLAGVRHFNERKTAGPAGFAVGDQADFFNCPVGLEESA